MDQMPYETKREYLEHLNDLIHSYPKREHVDDIKLFMGLEHVFVCLNIHDFDLDKNQDVWDEIRDGLAVHPLKNDGETLVMLRSREEEKRGHWWHNPRNWRTEAKTEGEELEEIATYLKEWKKGDDKYMVSNYFQVLEELDRTENRALWDELESILEDNFNLHSTCWKKLAAWTKEFKEEWWWKLGEEHCAE